MVLQVTNDIHKERLAAVSSDLLDISVYNYFSKFIKFCV